MLEVLFGGLRQIYSGVGCRVAIPKLGKGSEVRSRPRCALLHSLSRQTCPAQMKQGELEMWIVLSYRMRACREYLTAGLLLRSVSLAHRYDLLSSLSQSQFQVAPTGAPGDRCCHI